MRILRSIFALLFIAVLATSCADEEDYIRPDVSIEDAVLDGGDRPTGPPKPGDI